MTKLDIPDDHPVREFVNFCEVVWKHLNLPGMTPVQRDIAKFIQYGPKRLQVHAFRGVGKSYVCSAYVVWLLLLNPEEKILVISASKERSDQFVRFTRRLIDEMPILQHLIPDRNRGDRDSSLSFDVGAAAAGAHSPSVRSAGITGSITGSRASCIVLDDVEIPRNSETPTMRAKLATNLTEVDAILLPEDEELHVDPKVRVLGTPQTQDTVYTKLAENGYVKHVWPVEIPDAATHEGYVGALAPYVEEMVRQGAEVGDPVDPDRFDEVDIAERRMSFGTLGFALQFMLSTALSDAEKYPLRCSNAIVSAFPLDRGKEVYVWSNAKQYELQEECPGLQGDGWFRAADEVGDYVPFERTILAVDPSAKGKDETAVVSMSALSGQLFLHRCFASTEGYEPSVLEAIAMEAKRVKAQRIVVEQNYGGGMFSQLLRPVLNRIYPCTIEEIHHSSSKERRIIDTLAPVLEGHRMIIHEDVLRGDRVAHLGDSIERAKERQLFYQMTHLTEDRGCLSHDDRLDCLAIAVAHFQDALMLDANTEHLTRADARWAHLLEDKDPQESHSWLNTSFTATPSDPFSF